MSVKLRRALDGFYAFADRPVFLGARPALVALLVPLGLAFARPLWGVEISRAGRSAPLWLDVYPTHVASGNGGADLVGINAFHQSIGMRTIDGAALADLGWLPFGLGVLALLCLRVAALGNVRALVDLAVMVLFFLGFSVARFDRLLHTMGHQLSADAPLKVDAFQPVMMGTQQVGDVTVRAGPGAGAYLVAAFALGVVGITAWHLVLGRRRHAAGELHAEERAS